MKVILPFFLLAIFLQSCSNEIDLMHENESKNGPINFRVSIDEAITKVSRIKEDISGAYVTRHGLPKPKVDIIHSNIVSTRSLNIYLDT